MMASGEMMLVRLSLQPQIPPPFYSWNLSQLPPKHYVENGCLSDDLGIITQRKSSEYKTVKTYQLSLQGFIFKIVYSLHVILKELEISGEMTEHRALCYNQDVIVLKFLRQMWSSFKISEK